MQRFHCQPGAQRLLPEWAPLERVLLTWPRPSGDWGGGYAAVEACFTDLTTALLELTAVMLIAENDALAGRLSKTFPHADIAVVANNDIWVRDYGPLTAERDGQQLLVDAVFNGWGQKYPAELDNAVTRSLHKQEKLGNRALQTVTLILEGGAIETDGNGTLLSRLGCLPTRSSDLPLEDLNAELAKLFGLQQIAWLEHGELEGDDTDAHIDTLARFLPGNRLLYQACDNPGDSHYEPLKKMADELAQLRCADEKPYALTALPWPAATYSNGQRLPLSYANFLICNQHILLPTYGVYQDEAAIQTLKTVAPDFTVVPVNCRALVEQYGSLHCATMQIPAL